MKILLDKIHVMLTLYTTSGNACVQAFAKLFISFVDRCLRQVIIDLLQRTCQPRNGLELCVEYEMPKVLHSICAS